MREPNPIAVEPAPKIATDLRSYARGQLVLIVLLLALIIGFGRMLHLAGHSLAPELLPRIGSIPDPSEQLWGRMAWTSTLVAFVLASSGFLFAAHRLIAKSLDVQRALLLRIEGGLAVGAVAFIVGSVLFPEGLTPQLLLDVEKLLPSDLRNVPNVIRAFDGVGLAIGLTLVATCQCVLRGRHIRSRDPESLRLLSEDLNLLLYLGAAVLSLGVIASGVMHRWVGSEAGFEPAVVARLASAPMIALGTSYSIVLLCTYALTAMAVQGEAQAIARLHSPSFQGRQEFLKAAGLLIDPWERLSKVGLALLPLLVSGPIAGLLGLSGR